jgi:hypothetical protein
MDKLTIENKIEIFEYLYKIYYAEFILKKSKLSIIDSILYKLFGIFPKSKMQDSHSICGNLLKWFGNIDDNLNWEDIKIIIVAQLYPLWKDKVTRPIVKDDICGVFHFKNNYERMKVCESILKTLKKEINV